MLIISFISLSTFIGGIVMSTSIFNGILEIIEGVSLAFTIGMLLYIAIMELLPKVIHSKYKNITGFGVSLGVLLLLVTLII